MRVTETSTNTARTILGRLDQRWRRERATYRIPARVSDARTVTGRTGNAGRPSASTSCPSPLRRGDENLLESLEFLEALATSNCDAIERIASDDDRHPRLVLQPRVEPVQKRAAAGQHDALLHDVCGELGGCLVEGDFDRIDYR